MKKAVFYITCALGLLLAFQNCSEVEFAPADGNLVAKVEPGNDTASDVPAVENNDDNGDIVPPTAEVEGEHLYICILDGPGKSVRVGLESDAFIANGKTPATVCMSENACQNIVRQKFEVQGPAKRGFCPNKNPHVISLSDAQIQRLIGKN